MRDVKIFWKAINELNKQRSAKEIQRATCEKRYKKKNKVGRICIQNVMFGQGYKLQLLPPVEGVGISEEDQIALKHYYADFIGG